MMLIKHILLPTDHSDLARAAAAYARSLAEAYHATLHVLHIVECVPAAVPGPESGGVAWAVPGPESLAAAREATRAFINDHLAGLEVPIVMCVLEGAPNAQIARYAAEASIDLIVIGTHARGVVKRMFVGSTSKSVLEHAPCPVLMVPIATIASAEAASESAEPQHAEA